MIKCTECGNELSDRAPACPKCGAPRKKGVGVAKVLLVGIGGFVLLGMCAVAAASKQVAEERSTPIAGAELAAGEVAPVAKSSLGDQLKFGKPTLKPLMGTMSEVLVEVTNQGGIGATCTITATFKKGDTILGTANGVVNDIPPQGVRTVDLLASDDVSGFDGVKLETSACFPSAAKAGAAAAGARSGDPLKFGKPTVKNVMGDMNEVLVEASNTTDRKISCTVTATFKKADEILNTATGALNEIPAGGTKTAELMTTGALGDYDNVILEASACF